MMWNFERFGNRTALVDEHGASLTYRQLQREADALCAAAGGRCLTFNLCRNTLGSLLGYAGFVEGGVVPVLLNEEMDRELLKGLYDNYHPAFLWAPEDFTWDGCEPVYQSLGYHLLKTPFGREAELYPELGLLLTTSGSTGSPKFVRQSYRNIRANTDSIVEYLKLDETERPITTLPMNYTYGVSILNTHLDVGATILVTEHGIAQREFWDFFRRENATSFGGVPYTYEMLDRMRFFRMELPSLRTMTQAGGKLQKELHRKFVEWCLEKGKQFIVMYGQCEATARMAYLPWEKSLEKVGGIGVAIPGGQFRLIAADGSEITQPGVTGELKYYGDNVTLGYAVCQADLRKGDERGRRAGDRRHGAGGRGRLLHHRGPQKALFEAVWQPGQSGRAGAAAQGGVPRRGRGLRRSGRSSDVLLHRRKQAGRDARLPVRKDEAERRRLPGHGAAVHSQKRRGQDPVPGAGEIL